MRYGFGRAAHLDGKGEGDVFFECDAEFASEVHELEECSGYEL